MSVASPATAAQLALTIKRGITYVSQVEYMQEDGITPVDITGWTASLVVAPARGATPVLTLTPGSGLTLGGVLGTINISISALVTAALAVGNGYVYALSAGPIADPTLRYLLIPTSPASVSDLI